MPPCCRLADAVRRGHLPALAWRVSLNRAAVPQPRCQSGEVPACLDVDAVDPVEVERDMTLDLGDRRVWVLVLTDRVDRLGFA